LNLNEKFEFAVIELQSSQPGDLAIFSKLLKANIAIISSITYSHYKYFKSINAIVDEKFSILQSLRNNGTLLVNGFDQLIKNHIADRNVNHEVIDVLNNHLFSYKNSKVQLTNGQYKQAIYIKSGSKNLTITSLLMGRPGVIAVLFTYYISKIAMQSEKDFIKYSLNIKPAPGRLNLILGPKKSLIIDDTYNANPMSYEEAISVSNQLPFNYKIAILAGMSELGKLNVKLHRN